MKQFLSIVLSVEKEGEECTRQELDILYINLPSMLDMGGRAINPAAAAKGSFTGDFGVGYGTKLGRGRHNSK